MEKRTVLALGMFTSVRLTIPSSANSDSSSRFPVQGRDVCSLAMVLASCSFKQRTSASSTAHCSALLSVCCFLPKTPEEECREEQKKGGCRYSHGEAVAVWIVF